MYRLLTSFFIIFFICVLQPFQEYFTHIELIIHQRWAKTGERGEFFFFFFFFLIWVLRPFQEYFTYIEPIVHRRWAKTGEPGEKPPDHP